jgi:hypothetical protein
MASAVTVFRELPDQTHISQIGFRHFKAPLGRAVRLAAGERIAVPALTLIVRVAETSCLDALAATIDFAINH